MKDTEIHIAFGVHNHNEYYMHALVAMHSALSRTNSKLIFHILHDKTLNKSNEKAFKEIACKFKSEIMFYDLTEYIENLPIAIGFEQFSIGCMFPLFIPEILSTLKILYLDCDIIINIDISELIKDQLNDNKICIWAVPEVHAYSGKFKRYLEALAIDRSKYFNSGVLLFNNPCINSKFNNFTNIALQIIKEKPNLLYPDQDILNIIFINEHVGKLRPQANFQIHYKNRSQLYPENLENMIVHYSGIKPWNSLFPASFLYWKEREKMAEILKTSNGVKHDAG